MLVMLIMLLMSTGAPDGAPLLLLLPLLFFFLFQSSKQKSRKKFSTSPLLFGPYRLQHMYYNVCMYILINRSREREREI
jgi:hypothetical protein